MDMCIHLFFVTLFFIIFATSYRSAATLQPALDSSETCKYMLMVIWKSSAKKKLWVALLFGKRRAKD